MDSVLLSLSPRFEFAVLMTPSFDVAGNAAACRSDWKLYTDVFTSAGATAVDVSLDHRTSDFAIAGTVLVFLALLGMIGATAWKYFRGTLSVRSVRVLQLSCLVLALLSFATGFQYIAGFQTVSNDNVFADVTSLKRVYVPGPALMISNGIVFLGSLYVLQRAKHQL